MSIHTQKSQEVSSVKITSLECCVLNYCGYSSKARGIHFPKKWRSIITSQNLPTVTRSFYFGILSGGRLFIIRHFEGHGMKKLDYVAKKINLHFEFRCSTIWSNGTCLPHLGQIFVIYVHSCLCTCYF